jgi:hypothetical protein
VRSSRGSSRRLRWRGRDKAGTTRLPATRRTALHQRASEADRLRGGPDAQGGAGRRCLRACLPSLTYMSYRTRLMYGPGACVTIQIAIRAPTALPAPLAWQEGVILPRTPARLGVQQTRCPGSPIQGPGATSGTPVYQGRPRWPGRVLPPYCDVPTVPAGLGEGVTRSKRGRSIR